MLSGRRCGGIIWLSAALLATACASVDVSVDFDPQADFGGFRSFGLLPDPPPTGDPRADSELLRQRVRTAIGEQLELQGFTADAAPQMLVGYQVSVAQRLDVRTSTTPRGYSHWRGPRGVTTTTDIREYEQGTLVIDVVDVTRNALVWRGVGRLRLRSNPTSEQISERVRHVVAEILGRFPPAQGGA